MSSLLAAPPAQSDSFQTPNDLPVYVSKLPNPNDYNLFANGGWDGNWYVGFNTCWIKKLPSISPGNYARAYIGAKLGRMKLASNATNVWDKQAVPGSIYAAIASTAAWKKDGHHLLTGTEGIPLEGDYESAVEGTGESQWFWVEVPLQEVNFAGDNYLSVWSSTPGLLTVSSSPVLAAGWGGKEEDTWLLRDIQGAPPASVPPSLGTPIAYFQPAIALKLIPQTASHPLNVQIIGWKNATAGHPKPVVTVQIKGDSPESAWLEYFSEKSKKWTRVGRPVWKAPYIFSLDQSKLPTGRLQLRAAAVNSWEERGESPAFTIDVTNPKVR